jgi:anti-sigma factor RsiW
MLPDRYRQLLTAYVDGELSARQRRHAERLLRQSEEARRLLRQLEDDARALRALPPVRPSADLSEAVLRGIAERRLSPGRRRALRPVAAYTEWAGLAAAAAVLLVLGVASYLYFARAFQRDAAGTLAQQQPGASQPAPAVKPTDDSAVARRDGDGKAPPQGEGAKGPPQVAPPAAVVKAPDKGGDANPGPKPPAPPEAPKPDAVLTDRNMEMFKLDEVQVALPVALSVRDLEKDGARRKLLDELGKDSAFRLELPCRDGTRAFERFQAVCKARHIGLHIDGAAQVRITKAQWRTNYVVYLEGLTAYEWSALLRQLGQEDARASRRPTERQFDGLVVTRLTPRDHKELADLMGLDPTRMPPRPAGPLGTDLHKPLSEQTAEQLAQALAGQGGARPQPGKPAVKAAEHVALVMAYNPVRPRPGSPEVKRFLETRKPTRPGTIQVLLVLRGTNG